MSLAATALLTPPPALLDTRTLPSPFPSPLQAARITQQQSSKAREERVAAELSDLLSAMGELDTIAGAVEEETQVWQRICAIDVCAHTVWHALEQLCVHAVDPMGVQPRNAMRTRVHTRRPRE